MTVPAIMACALALLVSQPAPQGTPPAPTRATAPSSVVPVPRTDGAATRQEEVLNRVRQAKGPVPVVFVGDSITQGWEGAGAAAWKASMEPLGALNIGVGGDRTEHVLWRLREAPLTPLSPKAVVVMIGTNNAGHGTSTPGEILAGVRAVVSTILAQCPSTTVILLDIFPRGEQFNDMRGRIAQVNQALSRTEAFGPDASRVAWLPIGASFLELDGSISKQVMPDSLHLSAEGYERWAAALREPLRRAVSAP